MTLAPLPAIAAHTLYFVAPGDFVQAKCTGEAIGLVPSGGLCRSGATVRLQLSGGAMSNEKCADSSGPQPLKSATTHHSMWPGAKGCSRCVSVVSSSAVGAPSLWRRGDAAWLTPCCDL